MFSDSFFSLILNDIVILTDQIPLSWGPNCRLDVNYYIKKINLRKILECLH